MHDCSLDLIAYLFIFIVSSLSEKVPVDLRNILVSEGDCVTLSCNISINKVTQISWTKGRYVFASTSSLKQSYSNFTSDRLKIDVDFTTLNIINVQQEDAAVYICNVTDRHGLKSIMWNLTVSEIPKGR